MQEKAQQNKIEKMRILFLLAQTSATAVEIEFWSEQIIFLIQTLTIKQTSMK